MTRVLSVAGLLLFFFQPASAGLVVIDNFVVAQSVTVTGAPTATGTGVALSGAIGGERDLLVTKTTGIISSSLTTDVNPLGNTYFSQVQGAGVRGSTLVTWDGVDSNASVIDFTGLGGVDLGTLAGSFAVVLVDSDRAIAPFPVLRITVYDALDASGVRRATGNIAVPFLDSSAPTPPQTLTLNFSDMSLLGGADASLFRNVGAISMLVDGTGVAGWDVLLESIHANTVPVPGGLLLVGLGMLGFGLAGRRPRP